MPNMSATVLGNKARKLCKKKKSNYIISRVPYSLSGVFANAKSEEGHSFQHESDKLLRWHTNHLYHRCVTTAKNIATMITTQRKWMYTSDSGDYSKNKKKEVEHVVGGT